MAELFPRFQLSSKTTPTMRSANQATLVSCSIYFTCAHISIPSSYAELCITGFPVDDNSSQTYAQVKDATEERRTSSRKSSDKESILRNKSRKRATDSHPYAEVQSDATYAQINEKTSSKTVPKTNTKSSRASEESIDPYSGPPLPEKAENLNDVESKRSSSVVGASPSLPPRNSSILDSDNIPYADEIRFGLIRILQYSLYFYVCVYQMYNVCRLS